VKKSESAIYATSVLSVYLLAVFLTMWGGLSLICYSGGQALNITFTSGRMELSHDNGSGLSSSGIKSNLVPQNLFAPFSLSSKTSTLPSIKDVLWYFCPPVVFGSHFGIFHFHIPFWLIALICLIPLLVITYIDFAQRKQNKKMEAAVATANLDSAKPH